MIVRACLRGTIYQYKLYQLTSPQLEVSCWPSIIPLQNLHCLSPHFCICITSQWYLYHFTALIVFELAAEVGHGTRGAQGQKGSTQHLRGLRHGLHFHLASLSTHCDPGCIAGQIEQQPHITSFSLLGSAERFNSPQGSRSWLPPPWH